MSVVLYRKGEQILIEPQYLDAHLGNGYFVTIEESLNEENDIVEEVEKEIISKLSDEISDDDIRLIAKDIGISHWHNTSIDKLKAKIETKQYGDSE